MSFLVRYETELAMQTAAFFDEPPVQSAIVPTIEHDYTGLTPLETKVMRTAPRAQRLETERLKAYEADPSLETLAPYARMASFRMELWKRELEILAGQRCDL